MKLCAHRAQASTQQQSSWHSSKPRRRPPAPALPRSRAPPTKAWPAQHGHAAAVSWPRAWRWRPQFRNAVSAALDHAATAFAVADAAPLIATKHHGTLVIRGGSGRRRVFTPAATGPVIAAAVQRGGGSLTEAVRRDPQSEVTRLLERVVWVPDLGSAVRMAAALLPGWRCVTLAGDVVTDEGVVRLASERGVLDLRGERDALQRRVNELDARLTTERPALAQGRESIRVGFGGSSGR